MININNEKDKCGLKIINHINPTDKALQLRKDDVYLKENLFKYLQNEAEKTFNRITKHAKTFVCCLSDRPNDGVKQLTKTQQIPHQNKRKHHSIKCGCQWVIRYQPEKNTNYTGKDEPIRLTHVNMVHTSPCNSTPEQFSECLRKSGVILQLLSNDKLNHLANVLGIDQDIPLSFARDFIREVFPTNWKLSGSTVYNLIRKCRIFKSINDSEKPTLKANKDTPGYLELVGMAQKDLIDKSIMLSCNDLVNQLNDEDEGWFVNVQMDHLKHNDDGFDYRIWTNSDGAATGVVWVTSTMRFNYEKYGFCLFVDAMKRELNHHKWPYISVVVIDSYKKVRCCCESLVHNETIEGYK